MRRKVDPAKQALNRAAQINPYCDFVQSCREFYKERGFLTPKQVAALMGVRPPNPTHYAGPDYGDDDDNFMFGDDFEEIPNQ